MYTPRIPLEFAFRSNGTTFHIASGETARFWFGMLLALAGMWIFWKKIGSAGKPGGNATSPLDIENPRPIMVWIAGLTSVGLFLAGLDLLISGLIGTTPLLFN